MPGGGLLLEVTTSNNCFSRSNSNYSRLSFQAITCLGSHTCSLLESILSTPNEDQLSCFVIRNSFSMVRRLLSVNSGNLNF